MRECTRIALNGYNICVEDSAEEQYENFVESYGTDSRVSLRDIYDYIAELEEEGRKNSEFNY